jgi:hypothetical protein
MDGGIVARQEERREAGDNRQGWGRCREGGGVYDWTERRAKGSMRQDFVTSTHMPSMRDI